MRIGFTGTREGMTDAQKEAVRDLLIKFTPEWAHHGDCVGADADFHQICRDLGIRVKGHPPIKPDYRAYCQFDESNVPKAYYARNRDIVAESDLLLATPKETHQQPKGGTWYTVGYSQTVKKSRIIVWPDGEVWEVEQ